MFLEINALGFAYGKNSPWIIRDFSMRSAQGAVTGISGPSGRGKSTLLRIIAGLETPQTGFIGIDGKTLFSPDICIAPEHRHVGMVFQDYGLFPHMTVSDNIAYGLHRVPRNERRKKITAMLELVQMQGLANRYPFEISGGQQQRVALARALAPEPKVLLLDEPFSNLDAELKADIRAEMRQILERTNITCLFVSHDIADLQAVCDTIILMGEP